MDSIADYELNADAAILRISTVVDDLKTVIRQKSDEVAELTTKFSRSEDRNKALKAKLRKKEAFHHRKIGALNLKIAKLLGVHDKERGSVTTNLQERMTADTNTVNDENAAAPTTNGSANNKANDAPAIDRNTVVAGQQQGAEHVRDGVEEAAQSEDGQEEHDSDASERSESDGEDIETEGEDGLDEETDDEAGWDNSELDESGSDVEMAEHDGEQAE
jgi:hypothetical protein